MSFKSLVIFFAFTCCYASSAFSGMVDQPIGTIYPIKEESLLKVIMSRLSNMQKTGEIKKMQDEWKKTAINTINHPDGVDLPTTTIFKTHYYDPSIVLQHDVILPNGETLYKKGTKVNPLSIRGLSKRYIFIDGSDPEQVEFAKSLYEKSGWRDRVVLVKGSYMDLMKTWKHRVYFDQLGTSGIGGHQKETLVDTFQISAVPSVLFQNGLYLQIDAVPEKDFKEYLSKRESN